MNLPDPTRRQETASITLYQAVGGDLFFGQLVDHFYAGVDTDKRIRHMYPEDLTDSKRWMAGFLAQYFGGPATYSEQRGHPRLRMRHAPFAINTEARNAWMQHMTAAVAAMDPIDEVRDAMLGYFEMAANHMINTAD